MIWTVCHAFISVKKLCKLGYDPGSVFGIKVFEIVSIDHQVRNRFNILWNRPCLFCFIDFLNVFLAFYVIVLEINFLTFSRIFVFHTKCFVSSIKFFLIDVILIIILIFLFVLIFIFLFLIYNFFPLLLIWLPSFFNLFYLFNQINFKHYW